MIEVPSFMISVYLRMVAFCTVKERKNRSQRQRSIEFRPVRREYPRGIFPARTYVLRQQTSARIVLPQHIQRPYSRRTLQETLPLAPLTDSNGLPSADQFRSRSPSTPGADRTAKGTKLITRRLTFAVQQEQCTSAFNRSAQQLSSENVQSLVHHEQRRSEELPLSCHSVVHLTVASHVVVPLT